VVVPILPGVWQRRVRRETGCILRRGVGDHLRSDVMSNAVTPNKKRTIPKMSFKLSVQLGVSCDLMVRLATRAHEAQM